ncbi:VOC family protein [Polluticoccus soli]|uniref:VOC family protein n=1 Tax=Polluticoccus soli TaxID=3034150 RepID=UPI0023E1504C|nr:VOC family protein [Flavipsychrobacter sp. JY13-12]
MASLNPYVHFNGNCEEAFNFYKSIFGGDYTMSRFKDAPPGSPMTEAEGDKVLHISLPIGRGTVLMGSDVPQAFGPASIGNNFYVSVNADSREEADKLFKGLSEGGKVMMPLEDTFWGAYFGMFVDKFKVQWMISFDNNNN